jgi:hypothetical protein
VTSVEPWTILAAEHLPSGFVRVHAGLRDGRHVRTVIAPDEWAVYGSSRVIPILAALPGPPEQHY